MVARDAFIWKYFGEIDPWKGTMFMAGEMGGGSLRIFGDLGEWGEWGEVVGCDF